METTIRKIEAFLRVSATLLLILTACLVGLDSQTKTLYYTITRKATFRDLNALFVLVHIASVAAGYSLLQLGRLFISARLKGRSKSFYLYLAWVCFFLDQVAVYVVFSANTAALEASLLAVTGATSLQWMKVCNRYTRFCVQIGGALFCGYVASFVMAVVSFMSSFSLFRLYSPKHFLLLKGS